jgi:hypothetical protein
MRRIGGTLLTVTGFLACPCHLIITLPLMLSLLAGTALGSFLSRNTGLVTTFAGIYFVVALALGASLLFNVKRPSNHRTPACPPASLWMRTNLNPGNPHDQRASLLRDNIYVNPRAL